MSVLISGVLTDGAGLPMSGYHIILKARQNTSAVVMRTVATVVTGSAGEYAFGAQTGRYDVYLRSCIEREYCVGDISVYDDSKPGTLNDFLTALDEGDLKPDVVKRFEEMVAQAQQSAEAAAESERQAGQHVADAQQIKSDCERLADNVQQNAESVAEDKKHVEQIVSSVSLDADRAEQAAKNAELHESGALTALEEAKEIAKTPGPQGPQGETGPKGDTGPQGEQGPQGEPGKDADLKGIKATTPMGTDFNDAGMGTYAYPLLGQENSNAAAVSNHPIPGSTGNTAWGIVWAAPRSIYPAQVFMNYQGQMLSRIKANYGWSAWWQFAGKPLSEYPGTYMFSVTTTAVRYLQEVSGSTLTPQRAGNWIALGETAANSATLFQRIR